MNKPTSEEIQKAWSSARADCDSASGFGQRDVYVNTRELDTILEALDAALTAQPSKGCEMCGIDALPDIADHDPLPHEYWVWHGALWSWLGDYGGWEGSEISFCPNCGRRLEGV